ncbi:zinc finger protein 658B-like [Frankliniella occidentalis]|uniref:Zinc finger protein 658B-like n=1 Tax=Frankliniella occidentalis TaxID=133901 RepID=A0A9C6X093_FRAOC|nr:zinc finger protein 658B-like [Frankliniella occidentalis]
MYKCGVRGECKKRFSCKSRQDRHVRTQTCEKLYECDTCSKRFQQNSDLKRHVRTHTGEKPYECDICKMRFNKKDHLNRHVRIHTGEKPYKCDTCRKCFCQKVTLDCHVRVHTGEKPFECDVCSGGTVRWAARKAPNVTDCYSGRVDSLPVEDQKTPKHDHSAVNYSVGPAIDCAVPEKKHCVVTGFADCFFGCMKVELGWLGSSRVYDVDEEDEVEEDEECNEIHHKGDHWTSSGWLCEGQGSGEHRNKQDEVDAIFNYFAYLNV